MLELSADSCRTQFPSSAAPMHSQQFGDSIPLFGFRSCVSYPTLGPPLELRRRFTLGICMTFREQKPAHKAFRFALYGMLALTAVVFVIAFFSTESARHTPEDFAAAKSGNLSPRPN